jgi:Universal stress protein family
MMAQQRYDLIIAATHGRTGVKRWVLGSVAERLIESSQTPVLLVRAMRQEARAASARVSVEECDGFVLCSVPNRDTFAMLPGVSWSYGGVRYSRI